MTDEWLDEIESEGVRGRAAVDRLLYTDPITALSTARAIRHPWYRCQALAEVASTRGLQTDFMDILNESLAAAFKQCEPNRIITVAMWPLGVLLKVDRARTCTEVESLLALAATEPHGLRRLDALNSLLGLVAVDSELRTRVLAPYLETAKLCVGWRAERAIASMAQCLARFDLQLAIEIIASRRVNWFSKKALEAIEALRNNNCV